MTSEEKEIKRLEKELKKRDAALEATKNKLKECKAELRKKKRESKKKAVRKIVLSEEQERLLSNLLGDTNSQS